MTANPGLGAISYCLYLINEPIHKIVGAAISWYADSDSLLFTLLWIPAAIGLPLLAAAWLHTYLEAPALRWGRAVAQRQPQRQPRYRATPSVQEADRGL